MMPKMRILIIDSSAETRSMYADYFRHHGYRVAVAADCAEAVRVYDRARPDLVVTELSDHPEEIASLQTLRWRGAGRKTALITCSTRIDRHWPFAPSWLEADVAVPKPTSPSTLLGLAEALLARQVA